MELKQKILRSKLYKKITSGQNIFYSIYSVQSYIFEKELLKKDDYKTLIATGDKFNNDLINKIIKKVREIIQEVILEDKLFKARVYFKPKDIKDIDDEQEFVDRSQITSRPLHTSDLYTQIAIASILNGILYEEINGKIQLTEFGQIFPKNFYGNIPSEKPGFMFEPWQNKYNEYSKTVSERYSRYVETKEYSHEINIDLKNYYPSIHPLIVYEFIISVLASKYKEDDYECLKIMILKLLYLEVTNQELSSYYCLKEDKSYKLKRQYTQGVPQGLPQAYLFGNVCMLKVAKIYADFFEGEAFFYVDDSVIYSNKFKGSEYYICDFEEKIKELNQELEKLSNINAENLLPEIPLKKDIIELNTILDYTIRAHSISGKSEIYEINNEKIGNPNLNIMGRAASRSAFELATTFSDFEEITLMNRFEILKDSIIAEIDRVDRIQERESTLQGDQKSKDLKNYRERLIRYKKFMTYRERVLKFRNTDSKEKINEYIERLEDLLNIESKKGQINKKDIIEFFREYKDDIFWVELIYLLKRNNDQKLYNQIKKMIYKFDDIIYGKSSRDYAYLSKVIENLDVDSYMLKSSFNKYTSIQEKINRIYSELPYKHETLRNKEVVSLLKKIKEDRLGFFIKIDSQFSNDGYYRWVSLNTDELYRLVLNVYISKIYGVHINDSVRISKIHNRPITYRELRILAYIRNKYFNLGEFILFAEKVSNDDSNKPVNYAILDVIDIFVRFVKKPDLVDNLIRIHKFTNEIWKNGSKFLYFYTLHNEEHAITLIKAISNFVKNVDFLQIGQTDYYILFVSCYLHDVSMVIHPDLIKEFNKENNLDAKRIVSSFLDDFDRIMKKHLYLIDSKELRDLLIRYFKEVDSFFENNIRERHAKDSAEFIRKSKELSFIEKAIREFVAETSAAHWYNPNDIYDVKSDAKNTLISKKFIKILLRIADSLDVSDSRVSNAIYINNYIYMSNATRFHWLSHQAISGYSIETKYKNIHLENKKKNKDDNVSYISKNSIEESIVITFYLNRRCNLSTGEVKADCLYCALIDDNEEGIEIDISDDAACTKESCKLLCKWMIKKHRYLFQELFHLQRYLKRAPSNCFITKFTVKFMYNPEAICLKSEEQQIIKDHLGSIT